MQSISTSYADIQICENQSMDLQLSYSRISSLMCFQEVCFCSVESDVTGSRLCCGKKTDLYCCTKDLKTESTNPRDSDEARQITQQEFRWLMEDLSIEQKTAIKPARIGAVC